MPPGQPQILVFLVCGMQEHNIFTTDMTNQALNLKSLISVLSQQNSKQDEDGE